MSGCRPASAYPGAWRPVTHASAIRRRFASTATAAGRSAPGSFWRAGCIGTRQAAQGLFGPPGRNAQLLNSGPARPIAAGCIQDRSAVPHSRRASRAAAGNIVLDAGRLRQRGVARRGAGQLRHMGRRRPRPPAADRRAWRDHLRSPLIMQRRARRAVRAIQIMRPPWRPEPTAWPPVPAISTGPAGRRAAEFQLGATDASAPTAMRGMAARPEHPSGADQSKLARPATHRAPATMRCVAAGRRTSATLAGRLPRRPAHPASLLLDLAGGHSSYRLGRADHHTARAARATGTAMRRAVASQPGAGHGSGYPYSDSHRMRLDPAATSARANRGAGTEGLLHAQ